MAASNDRGWPEADWRLSAIEASKGTLTPFPARAGRLTLYVAMMTAASLDLVSSSGDIVFDGGLALNAALCATLAALRPGQSLYRNTDAEGAAALAFRALGRTSVFPRDIGKVEPWELPGLAGYCASRRARVYSAAIGSTRTGAVWSARAEPASLPVGRPIAAGADLTLLRVADRRREQSAMLKLQRGQDGFDNLIGRTTDVDGDHGFVGAGLLQRVELAGEQALRHVVADSLG